MRLNSKKLSMILGIIFVGIVDMTIPLVFYYNKYFTDRTGKDLYYNIGMAVLFILILGIIDVLFTCIPLFDLFKRFGTKNKNFADSSYLVKLMKIYVLAHFLVIPVNVLFETAVIKFDVASSITFAYIYTIYVEILAPVWFNGIMTRGIRVIYNFDNVVKTVIFFILMFWSTLVGIALNYILGNWIIHVFH